MTGSYPAAENEKQDIVSYLNEKACGKEIHRLFLSTGSNDHRGETIKDAAYGMLRSFGLKHMTVYQILRCALCRNGH